MEKAEHRTTIHDAEMARCIAATEAGQASWAGWKAPNKRCGTCASFRPSEHKWRKIGRCAKYTQLTFGKLGEKFPARSLACQYWEEKRDERKA